MSRRASLLLVALALVVALPAFAPARASAADTAADLTVDQAEAQEVALLNADRTSRGIAAVRVDSRLMAIARARSTDMATNGYFAHTQPDGRTAFTMISAAGIAWSSAGEIIAWNAWPTRLSSAGAANRSWLDSPEHLAILTDASYNAIGVGLAVDAGGRKLWTAVFAREPVTVAASTASLPAPGRPGLSARRSAGHRDAYLRWTTPTAPAGVRSYEVQRRVGSGAWVTITRTSAHTRTVSLRLHRHYRFRVRAIDRRGHAGAWSYVRSVWT